MTASHPQRILILGANYGLLPGVKLALAGHAVTLVGRREEVAAIAKNGKLELILPQRRSSERMLLEVPLSESAYAGRCALRAPSDVYPGAEDFVILAMQEPHFAAPEIEALMGLIGKAGLPCLSIMNLPPPPFMRRLCDFPPETFAGVYVSGKAWNAIAPELISLASPDAQAVRVKPDAPGRIVVTLPSNFKAAPFLDPQAQLQLVSLARDMSHLKVAYLGRERHPPVHLLASRSPFVALAKWPMLIAGNCRCFVPGGEIRSIAEAVHDDVEASRKLYLRITELARELGARDADLVAFESYARAAKGLTAPSSLARAIAGGVSQVERIDRLVLNLMRLCGLDTSDVASIADEIDKRLAANAAV